MPSFRAPKTTTSAEAIAKSYTAKEGDSNEFKWKAFSERDGNLVILTPASLTGRAARVDIVDDGKVLSSSSNISATSANGNRTHFRFDSPGTAWGMGEKTAVVYDSSGNEIGSYKVSDPSSGGTPDFGGEASFGEFTPIEAMPEINVNGLLQEMAGINRETAATNFPIAQQMGRTAASDALTDFSAFLERVMPGASRMTKLVSREAQNFIENGMPSAVQGNAMLRDAAMFASTGTRGDVAVRRGLANEASRDTTAVEYGMNVAQQLVSQASGVASTFAQLGANLGQSYMGLLTDLTSITPTDRVTMAFNERNYQTGVAEFNATGSANMSQFNAGQANSMSQFNGQMGFNTMQFQTQMGMQAEALREQARQAQKAAQAGTMALIGTLAGAAVGTAIAPGYGTMMGAQIGGGLGQTYGGYKTGNSAMMTQGLSTGMGAYSTYTGWQSAQQTQAFQQQTLDLQRENQAFYQDLQMQRASGGGQMMPASSKNYFNYG